MRIAHVLTRLLQAGSEENTIASCLAQVRNGHEVHLIHGQAYNPTYYDQLKNSIHLRKIESLVHKVDPANDFIAFRELLRIFKRKDFDIVHTHQSKAGILGRAAARFAGVPIVVHGVHILPFLNASPLSGFVYLLAERWCGLFTDVFIHVTAELRDECVRRGIGQKAHHIVAESGMNTKRFREACPPKDAAELLHTPNGGTQGPFVVLCLGALEPRKGHRRFLPVFSKIVARRPNTILLIAGEGPERSAIERDVRELGLVSHVRLLGFRTDPECLLTISNATVICSEREGLPRVAVQAALAGVPIVTTALPGIGRIVRDNDTGFVVPLEDIGQMEAAIVRLIDESDTRNFFRGRLLAGDYAPWETSKMTAKIEAAYLAKWQGLEHSRAI
jgi:glycosyltransferase involved in cell wall biosynthesis